MYSSYLSVVDSHLAFDHVPGPAYVVSGDGALAPVRFARAVSSRLTTPICVSASRPKIVRVSLARPTRLGPGAAGSPGALEVSYRLPARVVVRVQTFAAGRPVAAVDDSWGPGAGTGLVLVTPGSTVDELDLTLPPGACVNGVSAGWFVPTA
jgi:hypothetical protein